MNHTTKSDHLDHNASPSTTPGDATTANAGPSNTASRAPYHAPRLTRHGRFPHLTLQVSSSDEEV